MRLLAACWPSFPAPWPGAHLPLYLPFPLRFSCFFCLLPFIEVSIDDQGVTHVVEAINKGGAGVTARVVVKVGR
jgi:hypothetical protein